MLSEAGWRVQDKDKIDFSASAGIVIREYQTDAGPADYALFVDRKAVGVIEAKPEHFGQNITSIEEQSGRYASAALKWVNNEQGLPFVYESTGVLTRFTNYQDPHPPSRGIFHFPRPETLREWFSQDESLRTRLRSIPPLPHAGLRACQIRAIENLEESFEDDRPRALIQMATGSGKTYTAITSAYPLLKHASAKRILFLVDTRNLGEQAEQEFMGYVPNDGNRKFIELQDHGRPHCALDLMTLMEYFAKNRSAKSSQSHMQFTYSVNGDYIQMLTPLLGRSTMIPSLATGYGIGCKWHTFAT